MHSRQELGQDVKVRLNYKIDEPDLTSRYIGGLAIAQHCDVQAHRSFTVTLLEKLSKDFQGPRLSNLERPSRIANI
jgi:hypothetical protein